MKHFRTDRVTKSFSNYFNDSPLFASLLNYSLVKLSLKERPLLLFHNMEIVWSNLFILQQIIFVYEKSSEINLVVLNKKQFYRSLIVAVLINLFSFEYEIDNRGTLVESRNNRYQSYIEGVRLLRMIDEDNQLDLNFDLIKSVFICEDINLPLEYMLFKFLFETSVSFYGVPVRDFKDKQLAVSGIVYSISLELERQVCTNSLNVGRRLPMIDPVTLFDRAVSNYSAHLTREAIPKIRKLVNSSYLVEFSQVGVIQDIFEHQSYAIARKVDELSEQLTNRQKAEIGKKYQSQLLNPQYN
jgi:hypothetical protein